MGKIVREKESAVALDVKTQILNKTSISRPDSELRAICPILTLLKNDKNELVTYTKRRHHNHAVKGTPRALNCAAGRHKSSVMVPVLDGQDLIVIN